MIDFEIVSGYRVLLVGDGIHDEYTYVTPLGKSIKEDTLSTLYRSREDFRGGVWAAAEHVRSFCAHVDVKTGDKVMWNRRAVAETYTRKLFTMHEPKPAEPTPPVDIPSYDLVIVTDFGHGALTKALIARLSAEARYLAINAQTNTTNFGFNMITKYPRADLAVLDELEARLAVHEKDAPIEEVIEQLARVTDFRKVIITQGNKGATGWENGAFWHAPAMTGHPVDTLGAGDAFLAVVSPFARAGRPMRELLAIGNAAGAVKCSIVGHRQYVTKEALCAILQQCPVANPQQ